MVDIFFTDWEKWESRGDLEPINSSPGVYLLATFNDETEIGNPTPTNHNIIYIGQTCAQKLSTRLKCFENSSKSGKPAHSGGVTYYGEHNGAIDNLYVSIFAYGTIGDVVDAAYIKYIERHSIWTYCDAFKELPNYNKS